jgi:outer membrane cobalamin receptor
MVTSRITVFIIGFLLLVLSAQAQQNAEQPLRQALQSVEKKFNVVFTFADELVADVVVPSPSKKSSLDRALASLRQQTGLTFQQLNNRYIIISKPDKKSLEILCAYIRSSDTGEPVVGATVQAENEITVTNEAGYFRLPRKEGVILIRSLGYESLSLSASDFSGDCAPLLMKVSYTTLEEVTVNDVIATGIEEKVDGSVTLRPEILGILPGLPQPDALQTLQYLPSVKSVAEAAADINIRGGTNDQNLVLLDGIKVYQTGHFFGLISGLNPHIMSKVSLTKNGASAYYGDGTSGTIVIQAQEQVSETLSGGGGINLLYADGYLNVPISKKMSVQLAARRSLPSSWQTPTYQRYFNRAFSNTEVSNSNDSLVRNQDFYFFDTSVKFLYDITSRDKIRATFFNIANLLEYEETSQPGASIAEQKKSSLEQHSIGSSVTYSRLWSERVKTNVEGFVSGYSLNAINQNIPINQQVTQDNEVLDLGVRLAALIQLQKNLYLQTGYQFFESGITNSDAVNNPEFSRLIKEVNRTHALFVEGNYSSNEERTNLRFGLRSNYYTKLNSFFLEPRLVFNQKIGTYFSVKVLGELKTQTSVQVIDLQNDFLGVEKRRWLMANGEDVPMLKSKQASAGLNFNRGGLLLSADVFYKKVDGIITSSQGFQNQFQDVRASGNYDIKGLDILINQKIMKADVWLGYSLAESSYQFPDLVPTSFPNNLDIRHGINGGVSYRFNQVEISAGANWHSGRPVTNPVAGNEIVAGQINYESPNSARLNNYFRVDLSARWHFYYGNTFKSHVGISLWNVLNRENVLNQYYQINSTQQVTAVQQQGLAFTPNVFLRVDF